MLTVFRKNYRYIVWGLAIVFYFYVYIIEVSPSVMTHEFMSYFKIDGAQMGNLAACFFYAYFIMQIPMGLLLDRFGARRVMAVSIFVCSIGTFIVATSTTLICAEAGRFITGLGAASAAIGCLKITAVWFPRKQFAILAGFMLSVGMLGSVAGQAPLAITNNYLGWQNTLLLAATTGIILAFAFYLLVRNRKGAQQRINRQEKSASFFRSFIEVIRLKQTWLLSIYSGLAFTPIMVFGGLWGVSFLEAAHGYSNTFAATQVSLVFTGFAVGAPLAGWISEKTGRRMPIMYIGTITSMLIISAVIYIPSLPNPAVASFLFLFGFFISTFLLCFSMVREVNRLIFVATAIGFMNTFNAALGSIVDPIIGHILDLGWKGKMINGAMVFPLNDYYRGMALIPISLLIAIFILFFIKETYCKQCEDDNIN